MIKIIAVPVPMLEEYWDDIKADIISALEYCNNEMNIDHAKELIEEGELLPLVVYDDNKIVGTITIEIVDKPLKRIVNIVTTAGIDFDQWFIEGLKTIELLAKEHGADEVYLHGRKGWERKLKEYNYKHIYTVLGKVI